MDAALIRFCFTPWFAADTLHEFLIGLIPINGRVSDDLTGAVIEKAGSFFAFKMRCFLIDRGKGAKRVIFFSIGRVVGVFIALCIPNHPSASTPPCSTSS